MSAHKLRVLLSGLLFISVGGLLAEDVPATASQANPFLASGKVLIAAHRGGYENELEEKSPENSAVNIDNAVRKGFHVFETDLRVTKDGVFVVVHDPEISAETTGKGAAEEQTWAELKKLRKRYRSRGRDRSKGLGVVSEERIATFEELLNRADRRIILKVDLKVDSYLHFKEIMALVVKHGMLEWTIFRVDLKRADFFAEYIKQGNPHTKSTLMFKTRSKKQIDSVKETFGSSTIEVTFKDDLRPKDLDLVRYASSKGFLVEQHAGRDKTQWRDQVEAGVRMFHTAGPLKIQKFLASGQTP